MCARDKIEQTRESKTWLSRLTISQPPACFC